MKIFLNLFWIKVNSISELQVMRIYFFILRKVYFPLFFATGFVFICIPLKKARFDGCQGVPRLLHTTIEQRWMTDNLQRKPFSYMTLQRARLYLVPCLFAFLHFERWNERDRNGKWMKKLIWYASTTLQQGKLNWNVILYSWWSCNKCVCACV